MDIVGKLPTQKRSQRRDGKVSWPLLSALIAVATKRANVASALKRRYLTSARPLPRMMGSGNPRAIDSKHMRPIDSNRNRGCI